MTPASYTDTNPTVFRTKCQARAPTARSPRLLVAELLRGHLPQIQAQPVGHLLGQVVVGAPAEEHDVRHVEARSPAAPLRPLWTRGGRGAMKTTQLQQQQLWHGAAEGPSLHGRGRTVRWLDKGLWRRLFVYKARARTRTSSLFSFLSFFPSFFLRKQL